jgi:hypothetical protein
MIALWLASGVLSATSSAAIIPPSFNGYGVPHKWSDDDDARLGVALRALDRSVKQARTPRVRQSKLAMAAQEAEKAIAVLSGVDAALPAMADLTDVHRLLIDIKAGFLAYADWRQHMADAIARAMLALQIEADEDEEDAIWLLMMA